jgi:hypothetical protein
MSYVLRVGARAVTSDGPAGVLPIEGARACVEGDTVRILLAFVDPTASELRAVERAPVELGLFAEDGVAVLLVRIGEPGGPAHIESKAPLIAPDLDVHRNGCSSTHSEEGCASLRRHGAPPLAVEIALCDADTHLVRALRRADVSADLAEAVRRAISIQAATFSCAADAQRATLHATRVATVDDLMARAEKRHRIGGR